MRLYDLDAKTWSIHWASSRTGRLDPPVVGGFDGDRGTFEGTDVHDGRAIRVRFTWLRKTRDTARWEQRFSANAGTTWELNWVMDLTRAATSEPAR